MKIRSMPTLAGLAVVLLFLVFRASPDNSAWANPFQMRILDHHTGQGLPHVLEAILLVGLGALIFGALCFGSYVFHLLIGTVNLPSEPCLGADVCEVPQKHRRPFRHRRSCGRGA